MGFFKKKGETPALDSRPEQASDLDAAGRVRICEANCRTIEEARARALEELDEVEKRHHATVEAFEQAANAYRDEPSEQQAKLVREARERRDLIELELTRPREKARAAERAFEAASASAAQAREELAKVEETRRIEALREQASARHLHAVTRKSAERMLRAKAELEQAAEEIVAAFAATESAVNELWAAGQPAVRIETRQLMASTLILMAEADPSLIEGIMRLELALPVTPRAVVSSLLGIEASLAPYRGIGHRSLEELRDFFEVRQAEWVANQEKRRLERMRSGD